MGVGGQRRAPAALPPGKKFFTHSVGGWVGVRVGLDGCGKSRPHRDSIPESSSPQLVAIPTGGKWSKAPHILNLNAGLSGLVSSTNRSLCFILETGQGRSGSCGEESVPDAASTHTFSGSATQTFIGNNCNDCNDCNDWNTNCYNCNAGRAMAQAVSRWPLTAEARVLSRVSPCGICGGQSGSGTGFSPRTSVDSIVRHHV
jgi:hypothetical protein